jgi:hypothetical protein
MEPTRESQSEPLMLPTPFSHIGRFLQIAIWPTERAGWVRLFGFGLRLVDHRRSRPLFSERYPGQYGIRKRRYWHWGSWCLLFLTPRLR